MEPVDRIAPPFSDSLMTISRLNRGEPAYQLATENLFSTLHSHRSHLIRRRVTWDRNYANGLTENRSEIETLLSGKAEINDATIKSAKRFLSRFQYVLNIIDRIKLENYSPKPFMVRDALKARDFEKAELYYRHLDNLKESEIIKLISYAAKTGTTSEFIQLLDDEPNLQNILLESRKLAIERYEFESYMALLSKSKILDPMYPSGAEKTLFSVNCSEFALHIDNSFDEAKVKLDLCVSYIEQKVKSELDISSEDLKFFVENVLYDSRASKFRPLRKYVVGKILTSNVFRDRGLFIKFDSIRNVFSKLPNPKDFPKFISYLEFHGSIDSPIDAQNLMRYSIQNKSRAGVRYSLNFCQSQEDPNSCSEKLLNHTIVGGKSFVRKTIHEPEWEMFEKILVFENAILSWEIDGIGTNLLHYLAFEKDLEKTLQVLDRFPSLYNAKTTTQKGRYPSEFWPDSWWNDNRIKNLLEKHNLKRRKRKKDNIFIRIINGILNRKF